MFYMGVKCVKSCGEATVLGRAVEREWGEVW